MSHHIAKNSVDKTGKRFESSSKAKIRIEIGRRRKTQKEEALVTYDGDTVWELESSDTVEVRRSDLMVPIVTIREKSFCDILRNKIKNI